MKLVALILFFFVAQVIQGQNTFTWLSEIPCAGDRITVDELGNIYVQSSTYIERWNAQGGKKYRNSELQWGAYNAIDVTDPLRPFIHFPGAGKLVFFDNTLSVQGYPVDLFERGFDQIEYVAGSRGDALWLWDSRSLELVRVDRNFQPISSTGNLTVLLGTAITPLQIIERGSYVYMRTAQDMVLVFDMYGTYKTRLMVQANADMQVVNNRVLLFQDKELLILSVNSPDQQVMILPVEGAAYYCRQDVLYALQGGRLSQWKFPENGRN